MLPDTLYIYIYIYTHTTFSLSTHLLIHALATANNSAINIVVPVSFGIRCFHFLRYMAKSRIPGVYDTVFYHLSLSMYTHMAVLFLGFVEPPILFSTMATPIYITKKNIYIYILWTGLSIGFYLLRYQYP